MSSKAPQGGSWGRRAPGAPGCTLRPSSSQHWVSALVPDGPAVPSASPPSPGQRGLPADPGLGQRAPVGHLPLPAPHTPGLATRQAVGRRVSDARASRTLSQARGDAPEPPQPQLTPPSGPACPSGLSLRVRGQGSRKWGQARADQLHWVQDRGRQGQELPLTQA